jgi:hypothetical protein
MWGDFYGSVTPKSRKAWKLAIHYSYLPFAWKPPSALEFIYFEDINPRKRDRSFA